MKRRQRISLTTLPALLVLLVSTLIGTVAPTHADDRGPGAHVPAPSVRPAPARPAPAVRPAAGPGAVPLVAPGRPPLVGGPLSPRICIGAAFTKPTFFCGDPRLGPRVLPSKGLIGSLLVGYRRLAGQNANGFLQTWFNTSTQSYRNPPNDGFLNPPGLITLSVGQRIDRFGGEGGRFLAPAGSPYAQRSLTPQSLNTFDGGYPFNYHLYKVVRPFTVRVGLVAPFYGQPGNGLQYVLPDIDANTRDSVLNHVLDGSLQRLN
ncbi:TNT domain-containing protein [Streptomyces sp. NPDC058691]|uniref:TNT domain-containing protein n=1 Tax=Streptomyces sp. NPDC058691 TaxID=3346601 RepID=UPI003669977F